MNGPTLHDTTSSVPVVDTPAAAHALAAWVLDPGRVGPVVALSVHPSRGVPAVDAELLERVVAAHGGSVYLLATTAATWELKRRLPEGLDVYGDALRLWHPWRGTHRGPVEHPLVVLSDEPGQPGQPDWVAWVEAELGAGAVTEDVQTGVVEQVDEQAVVRLPDGRRATVASAATEPSRLLRVAQTVLVRLTGRDARGALVAEPVLPDPLVRLREQCPVHSTVMGRVVAVRSYGALVELLPGLVGLLHVGELAPGWVRHPEDHLREGTALRVRLLDLGGSDRVLLSRLELAPTAIRPTLLRDGPVWIDEAEPPAPSDASAEGPASPVADELGPWSGSWDDARGQDAAPREGGRLDEQLDLLEDAVGRARDAVAARRRLVADGRRELSDLRRDAAGLVHELEQSLAEARGRVLATLSDQTDDVLAATRGEVERARIEVATLQARLAGVEAERAGLAERVEVLSERAGRAERRAGREADRADRARSEAAVLRDELDRLVPEEDRLVAAIRRSWLASTTSEDRAGFPWRDPVVGPELLASLREVEGVSRERVVEVCSEVVCGRAATRPALGVHPLRAAAGAGSPQLTRADGARAFRVSLQVRTAAARRLHYWELPDGGVELARIGYHDDFTI